MSLTDEEREEVREILIELIESPEGRRLLLEAQHRAILEMPRHQKVKRGHLDTT